MSETDDSKSPTESNPSDVYGTGETHTYSSNLKGELTPVPGSHNTSHVGDDSVSPSNSRRQNDPIIHLDAEETRKSIIKMKREAELEKERVEEEKKTMEAAH